MTNVDDTLVIYMDKRKALHRLRLRTIFILFPMLLGQCAYFSYQDKAARAAGEYDPFYQIMIWIVAIEVAALIFFATRSHKRQTEPIVTLSPEGIETHSLWQHVGLLRWDEIEEIRAYTFLYRYVGITPRDMGAVCRRLGAGKAWMVWLNDWSIRLFYRPLRIYMAPINIPQEYLPITADELMEHICAYQAAYAPASAVATTLRP